MNDMGSNYVESIIKKALDGSMTTKHAARKPGSKRPWRRPLTKNRNNRWKQLTQ